MLGAVRALNRIECAGTTLRAALNALAVAAPDWFRVHSDPAWVERDRRPVNDYRLPVTDAARHAYAEQIGRDGHALLADMAAPDAPAWVRELPDVETLRRVWEPNFAMLPAPDTGAGGGDVGPARAGDTTGSAVAWRTTVEGFPPSLRYIASPYDADVHYAEKRTTQSTGG